MMLVNFQNHVYLTLCLSSCFEKLSNAKKISFLSYNYSIIPMVLN